MKRRLVLQAGIIFVIVSSMCGKCLSAETNKMVNPFADLLERAKTHYAEGRTTQAREHIKEFLSLAEEDALYRLMSLERDIATFCKANGDTNRAIEVLKRSIEIAEQNGGPDHPEIAISLTQLGALLTELHEYERALPLLRRSLAIYDKVATATTPEMGLASLIDKVAFCHEELGQFSDALPLRRRSLSIREAVLGRSHSDLAEAVSVVATLSYLSSDLPEAAALLKRAVALQEKIMSREASAAVASLLNPATVADSVQRAGVNAAKLISKLLGLAAIQRDMGDHEAATSVKRALSLAEQTFGNDHALVAAALNMEATLYLVPDRYELALPLLIRSLEIQERALGKDHPELVSTLNNLALAQKNLGRSDDAVRTMERSLALGEAQGKEHPGLVTLLLNLGSFYRDEGNFSAALPLLQRSLELGQKMFGRVHPATTLAACHLAIWDIQQGTFPEHLFVPGGVLFSWRTFLPAQLPFLTDTEAFQFLDRYVFLTEGLHSMCALNLKGGAGKLQQLGAEGLLQSKAIVEEAGLLRAILETNPSNATRKNRDRLRAAHQKLLAMAGRDLAPDQRASETREAEEEVRQLEDELARTSRLVADSLRKRDTTLAEVIAGFPTSAALIDLIQYRRWDYAAKSDQRKEVRYAAYLTFPMAKDSTNVVVERVDLGEAGPINEAVELICRRMGAGQFRAKDLETALQRLSELVYVPLARHLTNVSHLIVCPDGQLSRVPFEMLLVSKPGEPPRYLVEEKIISYVGSGREVARLAQPSARVKTNAPVVMGNPDFDLDLSSRSSRREEAQTSKSEIGSRKSEENKSLLTSAATRPLSRTYRGFKFAPLPGAEEEAAGVAKMLGGDCVMRLGKDAREAELKAVVSPCVLHLATHGFFLTDQEFKRTNAMPDLLASTSGFIPRRNRTDEEWENPMVRCGIALAGANHARQITNAVAEDGLLTGLEASLLNLQGTELVILSACESGAGEVKIGEGVMSLRRAFRIAGAETVLASHWQVNDRATSRLMTEFMRRWRAGEPRAKAWREAQLLLLRSKDFSNPYFWAAFTLTGQWR